MAYVIAEPCIGTKDTACVDACPAGAPSGREWRPELKREDFFDAMACYDEAKRQGAKADASIICGICIAACPHTRHYLAQAAR